MLVTTISRPSIEEIKKYQPKDLIRLQYFKLISQPWNISKDTIYKTQIPVDNKWISMIFHRYKYIPQLPQSVSTQAHSSINVITVDPHTKEQFSIALQDVEEFEERLHKKDTSGAVGPQPARVRFFAEEESALNAIDDEEKNFTANVDYFCLCSIL